MANAPYFRFSDLGSSSSQVIVLCCWTGRSSTLTVGWAIRQTISISFQCFHG